MAEDRDIESKPFTFGTRCPKCDQMVNWVISKEDISALFPELGYLDLSDQAFVECPKCGGNNKLQCHLYTGEVSCTKGEDEICALHDAFCYKPCPTCTSGKMYLYAVDKDGNARLLSWQEYNGILGKYAHTSLTLIWRDNILCHKHAVAERHERFTLPDGSYIKRGKEKCNGS